MRGLRAVFGLLLCLTLLTGCSGQTGEAPGFPSQDKVPYPLEFTDPVLTYPASRTQIELRVPEAAEDMDALAEAVDTALFLSPEIGEEMVYIRLGDSLREEAADDPAAFVGRVLQIALLGHTFCRAYDDSRLSEGLLGFRGGFSADFATVQTPPESAAPVISYEFYRNSLQRREHLRLEFADLPICGRTDRYLAVGNTEQLIYAAQYGYLPDCLPGSDAETVLRRCVDILSQITDGDMSETEVYRAIYQYVVQSNQYDYQTLLENSVQNSDNRVFFLEGAVLDGRAVCDGMSKELVLLACLMGLEAYHVGARNGESGHAYVYVKVDGSWYLSCPTYGSHLYSRKDGVRQDYHTNNYMLTDFDTNMAGWPYDSDAFEQIEPEIQAVSPFDYWAQTTVEIGGRTYDFHPESVEEAMPVLEDAARLSRELGIPVEVELCGKVDVLRQAYDRIKEQTEQMVYLSGGTFNGQRLQVYLIGAQS